ncbi:MAG: hypothetical protein K2F88_00050 [Duncaniella sp.]|uniref:hypothetical protein n=1 Tax=Duncaniella sp. TaxID=2518496 RepID=UPI0023D7843C|nr:hypothetical protein [Duncaniella sp.]MDE5989111.1 hypothetical protein [Duncaniella sp.]MDE6173941.1 hypothetical protein [Duncaniella sp.]
MKLIRYVAFMAVAVVMAMTTACGSSDKALNMAVEEINKQLEGQKMPGIEKMSLSTEDGYIVYNYLVDEDQADINLMKESADQQKAQVKSQVIGNPAQEKFIQLVKLADRGLKFSYKGNKSGDGYEIVFENDEL